MLWSFYYRQIELMKHEGVFKIKTNPENYSENLFGLIMWLKSYLEK